MDERQTILMDIEGGGVDPVDPTETGGNTTVSTFFWLPDLFMWFQ